MRAVEGESAGLDLSEADAAVDAGEVLGVEGLHAIDDADKDDAVSKLQGRLYGVGEAGGLALAFADDQAVYDDLDGVFLLLVEAELLGEVSDLAVDPHADESGPSGFFEDGLMLAFAAGDHGAHDHDSGGGWDGLNGIDDLLDSLAGDQACRSWGSGAGPARA